MKKTKRSIKIQGLEDELNYCLKKIVIIPCLDHWKIRAKEIEAELKTLKKKGKK